ncbi:MAG: bifunctional riboflavin kinase/FAD synthetase, partial [Proteobacteria bacterium]|nr:bifunctional riboflavin kinase/FAD synthetase [Pseudomonadota bacterium]
SDSLDGEWVITIGNFDGYHLGHQELVRQVLVFKKKLKTKGGILTFEPHPKKVLQSQIPFRLIYDNRSKLKFLEQSGLDSCFVVPFTLDFASLSSQEFLEKLFSFVRLKKIIVGYDFNFGKAREGSASLMKQEAAKRGIDFLQLSPVKVGEITVSSTMIRRLLFEGDFENVTRYLGRPWSINGIVKEGKKLGHTIGFPTLNLEPEILLPLKKGVFACQVELDDRMHNGVCNVGINPTFDGKILKVEAHIFDYCGDAYHRFVRIFPQKFLREEKKFASVDILKEQIQNDVDATKQFFADQDT